MKNTIENLCDKAKNLGLSAVIASTLFLTGCDKDYTKHAEKNYDKFKVEVWSDDAQQKRRVWFYFGGMQVIQAEDTSITKDHFDEITIGHETRIIAPYATQDSLNHYFHMTINHQ